MAAGLSMPEENLDAFRRLINEKSGITEDDLAEKISIDMQLPFSCITESFIRELSVLEPFGKGNTKPLFAERNVLVKSARILGKNQNVLKLRVEDQSRKQMDAVYFGNISDFQTYIAGKYGRDAMEQLFRGKGKDIFMAFTYYPDINEYHGIKNTQIIIQNYK